MRIAVMSDTHDNIWNLAEALRLVNEERAAVLLFLGDFCAPFTLAQIAEGFAGPIHAVFGNNDGDPFLLSQVAARFAHVTLHGQYAELEYGGRRIAINHYPDIARRIAESGMFDAVFYGHDHTRHSEMVGRTLLANPGEVMGRFGEPTFGVYETESGTFTHVHIPHNHA